MVLPPLLVLAIDAYLPDAIATTACHHGTSPTGAVTDA